MVYRWFYYTCSYIGIVTNHERYPDIPLERTSMMDTSHCSPATPRFSCCWTDSPISSSADDTKQTSVDDIYIHWKHGCQNHQTSLRLFQYELERTPSNLYQQGVSSLGGQCRLGVRYRGVAPNFLGKVTTFQWIPPLSPSVPAKQNGVWKSNMLHCFCFSNRIHRWYIYLHVLHTKSTIHGSVNIQVP